MATMQLTPEELANTPAQAPPPGVTPNFVNPETSAPAWTAGLLVAVVLMLGILSARLYGKARVVKKLGWDDLAAFISGIITTTMAGVVIFVFWRPGFATHTWDVPLITYFDPNYTARLLAIEIISPLSSYFTKLSILLFLLNLFPRTARKVTAYALYVGIFLNSVFYFITTLYTIIVCTPRYGDNGMLPAQCSSEVLLQVGEAVAGVNMVLDLYTLGVSIPTVVLLQMSVRRKVGVILILCTGLIACVCSILTLAYRLTSVSWGDPAWNQCAPIALGTFESCAGVIAACLPCMPSVWHHFSPRVALSWRRMLTTMSKSPTMSKSHGSGNGSDRYGDTYDNSTSLERVVASKDSAGYNSLEEHELSHFGETPSKTTSRKATTRNTYEV